MIQVNYIKIEQPIGTFYITSIDAKILAQIATIERRKENPDAVQRDQSESRIKEIAKYCSDPDATFPTPIIISVDNPNAISFEGNRLIIDENQTLGEVIDGQHRLEGLKRSNFISRFQLPVVLMIDLIPEEKAYVFSIINSKQTRVSMSLIYDLFALSSNRSPYKTCHEIARSLNKEENSPFYNRLKMLGKKTDDQLNASLSQGTFIKYLVELISKNPEDDTRLLKKGESIEIDNRLVLRHYFIDGKDSVIYKIILNTFLGVKLAFPQEWNDPNNYILSKAIGFGAIIKAFPTLYNRGVKEGELNVAFFEKEFLKVKELLFNKKIELTSLHFGSNEQARTQLANLIKEAIDN